MRKRFILLLGVVLGSYVPMSAQTRAPQTIPAQDRTVMSMTVIPAAPAPLFAPSFLLPENPAKSAAPFSYVFAWPHERDQGLEGLKSLSQMHKVKTLFLTSRCCRFCNSGADVCGLTALRARFTCRTCNLVLQPLAVCWTIVPRDKVIRAARSRSISPASA